jgi:hypothetical protein
MEDHVLWTTENVTSASGTVAKITLTREDLNAALSGASLELSWLDALLENPNVRVEDGQGILNRIAALVHIAAPALLPADTPYSPDPKPGPVPSKTPKIVLCWAGSGVFDIGAASSDLIEAKVLEPGSITTLKITKIGERDVNGGTAMWNGLTFAAGFDAARSGWTVEVSGTPSVSGIFELSVEMTVSNGSQTATLAGGIGFLIRQETVTPSPIVDPAPEKWFLSAARNEYGAWDAEIEIPLAGNIADISDLVYVRLANLSNASFGFDAAGTALRVTGTAENREALDTLSVSGIDILRGGESAGSDSVLYEQNLEPAVTGAMMNRTIEGEGGGGSGGCNAGLGLTVLVMAIVTIYRRTRKIRMGRGM